MPALLDPSSALDGLDDIVSSHAPDPLDGLDAIVQHNPDSIFGAVAHYTGDPSWLEWGKHNGIQARKKLDEIQARLNAPVAEADAAAASTQRWDSTLGAARGIANAGTFGATGLTESLTGEDFRPETQRGNEWQTLTGLATGAVPLIASGGLAAPAVAAQAPSLLRSAGTAAGIGAAQSIAPAAEEVIRGEATIPQAAWNATKGAAQGAAIGLGIHGATKGIGWLAGKAAARFPSGKQLNQELDSVLSGQTPDAAPIDTPTIEQPSRQPWQMTRSEWAKSDFDQQVAAQSGKRKMNISQDSSAHKQAVESALQQGLPVPPEVVRDYPDLIEKYIKLNAVSQHGSPIEQPAATAIEPQRVTPAPAPTGDNPLYVNGRGYDIDNPTFKEFTRAGLSKEFDAQRINWPDGETRQIGEFYVTKGTDKAGRAVMSNITKQPAANVATAEPTPLTEPIPNGKTQAQKGQEDVLTAPKPSPSAPEPPAAAGEDFGSPQYKMPRSLDPKAPITKASDIIDRASKELNLPIRAGHLGAKGRKYAGLFKVKSEIVRNKEHNDLVATAHEIGHAIEKQVYGYTPGSPAHFRTWRGELQKLGRDLYGSKNPTGGYTREGFAEFMRAYTLTGDAQKLAPNFYDHFTKTFLPGNPEIASAIENFRQGATQWNQQGSVNRVLSQIDFTGKGKPTSLKEKAAYAKNRLVSLATDSLDPLRRAETEMGKGSLQTGEQSPYKVARSVNQSAAAKAYEWVMDSATDIHGNAAGPSLKQVLEPVADDSKNFLAYAYARRGKELLDRGINPGISAQDINHTLTTLKSPAFDKAAQGLTEWNDHLLNYLVEAGGLSQEAKDAISKANQAYLPLKRVFEQQEGIGGGTGKGFVDLASPVKRIKGSSREIVNPLESMVGYAEQIISIGDRARVARALVNLAEKSEGAGKWVEKLPTPIEAKSAPMSDLKAQLEAAGADLSTADMDAVLTIYNQSPRYVGKENIVTVWREGKREFFELAPDLFRSLKGLDQQSWPWWTSILTKPASAVRLGATGLRGGFSLITNPIRDYLTAAIQSNRGAANPKSYFGALRDVVKNEEPYKLFKRGGGEMAQPLGVDRRSIQKAVNEALANTKQKKALNIVKHPIDFLREVMSFSESTPRVSELTQALKQRGWKPGQALKPGDLVEAMHAAGEVTVDFRRAGSITRELNRVIPFFNPSIQGLSKFGRTLAERPGSTLAKSAALMTAPTLALWWYNKDEQWYKELPDWQKYGFWNIKVGEKILKIPRPFEWGYLFAAEPEAIAESIYRKNPEAFKSATQEALSQISPDFLPAFAKPALEVSTNKDFFRERPIVPDVEKDMPPEDQYGPHTTGTAKTIGKMTGTSPRNIEHLAEGYTGGLATDAARAVEGGINTIRGKSDSPPMAAADIPVVGRLFGREPFGPQAKSIQKFYDKLDQLEGEEAAFKRQRDGAEAPNRGRLSLMRRVARTISTIRKRANETKNPAEAKRLWKQAIDMSKNAMGEK